MLNDAEIVAAAADALERFPALPLVLDPVMLSTSGTTLPPARPRADAQPPGSGGAARPVHRRQRRHARRRGGAARARRASGGAQGRAPFGRPAARRRGRRRGDLRLRERTHPDAPHPRHRLQLRRGDRHVSGPRAWRRAPPWRTRMISSSVPSAARPASAAATGRSTMRMDRAGSTTAGGVRVFQWMRPRSGCLHSDSAIQPDNFTLTLLSMPDAAGHREGTRECRRNGLAPMHADRDVRYRDAARRTPAMHRPRCFVRLSL
jgi:hypothetical protein